MSVESYCATVTLSSATVPSGQYAKYNGANSQAICSVDANLADQYEDGWTTIIGKHKKKGQETKKRRWKFPRQEWKCSVGVNGCSRKEHDRPRPKGLHFIVIDNERECKCINQNMFDNDNYINNKLTI